MGERELVRLSIQLPVEALERFSRLMERVERLLGGGTGQGRESAESSAFDPARFRALEEAGRVEAAVSAGPGEPAQAGEAAPDRPPEPGGGPGEEAGRTPPSPEAYAPGEEASARAVRAGEEETAQAGAVSPPPFTELEAPALRAEMGAGPETPAGTTGGEKRPEASQERPPAVERTAAAGETPRGAKPAHGAVETALEEARSAKAAVESVLPQPRLRRLSGAEELVSAGRAPLTAEAVSMAVARDSRRYDNGFPFY